jgi:hypothetical protein
MTASDFLAAGDWSLQRFKQMGQPFVGNTEAVEAYCRTRGIHISYVYINTIALFPNARPLSSSSSIIYSVVLIGSESKQ